MKNDFQTILLEFADNFKKELSILLVLFFSFISPIKGLMLIVGSVVVIDTLFGVYASVKLNGIKSFVSTKLFNIVIKTFFYMGSIFLAFLISKYMFDGSLFGIKYLIPKVLCGFWVFIEVKSIDETSVKLGNKPVLQIINGIIKKAKTLKKDLNELK